MMIIKTTENNVYSKVYTFKNMYIIIDDNNTIIYVCVYLMIFFLHFIIIVINKTR